MLARAGLRDGDGGEGIRACAVAHLKGGRGLLLYVVEQQARSPPPLLGRGGGVLSKRSRQFPDTALQVCELSVDENAVDGGLLECRRDKYATPWARSQRGRRSPYAAATVERAVRDRAAAKKETSRAERQEAALVVAEESRLQRESRAMVKAAREKHLKRRNTRLFEGFMRGPRFVGGS